MLPESEKRALFRWRGVEQKVLLWFYFHRSEAKTKQTKKKYKYKIKGNDTRDEEDLGGKWWLRRFQG